MKKYRHGVTITVSVNGKQSTYLLDDDAPVILSKNGEEIKIELYNPEVEDA